MYAALCIISIAMCSRNPKFVVKQPVNKDAEQPGEKQLKEAEKDKGSISCWGRSAHEPAVTLQDALASWKFWLLALLLFQGLFFGLYMASVFKFAA